MSSAFALLLALAGCTIPGSSTPVEAWEMLGISDTHGLLDVQATAGTTGMLRAQGHMRLDHRPAQTTPIRHARHAVHPTRVEGGVDIGPDTVRIERDAHGERWLVQVRSEDVRGTLLASEGRIQGWIESMNQGGLIDARGVVLHHTRPWAPSTPREAVFVMHRRLSIGLDSAGQPDEQWAHLDGIALDTRDMKLEPQEKGWRLDLRPAAAVYVDLRPTGHQTHRDPHGHLWAIERLILDLSGARRIRGLAGLRAEIHGAGLDDAPPLIGHGLRLTVGVD